MMLNLDNRAIDLFVPPTQAASQTGQTRAQSNTQGWLKAMEQAGLQDALSKTRVFKEGENTFGDACATDGRISQTSQPSRISSFNPVQDINSLKDEEPTQQGKIPQISLTVSAALNRSESSTSSVCDSIVAEARHILSVEQASKPTNALSVSAEFPTHKHWATRNLLLLPIDDGGVEIWIRDAKITEADVETLHAELCRTVAQFSGGPLKLYINGQQISRTSDGHSHKGD